MGQKEAIRSTSKKAYVLPVDRLSTTDRFAGSKDALEQTRRVLATGVTSHVRRAQLPTPLFVDRAAGAHIVDVDGNEYTDYVLGYGPNLFGYTPEPILEAVHASLKRGLNYGLQHAEQRKLAAAIARTVPCAELVCFLSTGSEAAHSVVRLVRASTGRRKIVKFEGHWHGWIDPLAVSGPRISPHAPSQDADAANSNLPQPLPGSLGQTIDPDILLCEWNSLPALSAIFEKEGDEVAAVIMEASSSNAGVLLPEPGYLEGVRQICTAYEALLVFDEVITGFRVALGGAQERFSVLPDLCILGKALGAGFPISAVAGTEVAMKVVADGSVAHRGTFNGNSMSVAAALKAVEWLENDADEIYGRLETMGTTLKEGLEMAAAEAEMSLTVQKLGGILTTHFTERKVISTYREACEADDGLGRAFAAELLRNGVQILPRGTWFLSLAHTDEDIERTIIAAESALERVAPTAGENS
jgi:glutamate-1-semialdehyde 2,1-aminomutase